MEALKLITAALLCVIFYQDAKSRMVHGFLFPVTAILLGILHYVHVEKISFFVGIAGNIGFISLLIFVLFLYSKIRLKMPFINGSFGLGDLLFFYAICFAFPNFTFTVLFVFAVFFAMALHLLMRKRQRDKTIPLAGYMALFFAITFCTSIFYEPLALYLL